MLLVSLGLTSCKETYENVYVQICLSTEDVINLELYHDKAPATVENFVKLAKSGYYEGTFFHRIINGFMIQGGGFYINNENQIVQKDNVDPIFGEFKNNGFYQNDLLHTLGTISMARASDPNSATSQFFLCSSEPSYLNSDYAAFGHTTDDASNDVILKIAAMSTITLSYYFQDFPVSPVIIKEIKIAKKVF